MSLVPFTVGSDQPLAVAHKLMNEHAIRHLPVLDGGQLVGVLTQRDLHLIETLKGVDTREVPVSDAMSPEPYVVGPKATVRKVAAAMAEHKYGCAVVMEKDTVVGVFTTVDALRALNSLLDAGTPAH
ncbi:MAG: CBS domain-containing protein [Myxococcaceae bacterium]|nr:CBS domain-containing protein [Myxococcaceae bacterium]